MVYRKKGPARLNAPAFGGFTLIEVLISISLLLVFVIGSLSASTLATQTITINQNKSQANRLAKEAMEAVMSIRAAAFSTLSPGTFHPTYSAGGWSLTSGSEVLGSFTRTITLTRAARAISCEAEICDLVAAGGITDPSTFHVTVEVSWPESGQTKKTTLNNLITNWR